VNRKKPFFMRMPVVGQQKPVMLKNKGTNNFYHFKKLKTCKQQK